MNNTLNELKRFQTDRLLYKQPFNKKVCTMNIIEEIFEMYGIGSTDSRRLEELVTQMIEDQVDRIKQTAPTKEEAEAEQQGLSNKILTYDEPTIDDVVDSLCDMQVFAGGDVLKNGYDNESCLAEVAKELHSREGEIIEGKFQKYKTPEAMEKWYKADFSKCKLKEEQQ